MEFRFISYPRIANAATAFAEQWPFTLELNSAKRLRIRLLPRTQKRPDLVIQELQVSRVGPGAGGVSPQ